MYMCSIPQKHPAASVAFCAPAGRLLVPLEAAPSPNDMVAEFVKGRVRRWKMLVMLNNAMKLEIKKSAVSGFSLMVAG